MDKCQYCNLQCREYTEKYTNLSQKETSRIANCNGYVETDDNNYINEIYNYMIGFNN